MWIVVSAVYSLKRSVYSMEREERCKQTTDMTEEEADCLLQTVKGVRFIAPVSTRGIDECVCTSYENCVSNGVDVRPRCGCQDFSEDGNVFCYVVGYCQEEQKSNTFPGARYRSCTGPPPPPPSLNSCTDPLYTNQWHLSVINAEHAWNFTRGVSSSVVVIDDGVQYAHPDLHVDTTRSFGWNVQTGAMIKSADYSLSVHGTASAGVSTARRDNGIGGCGVAPDSKLVAVRLLNSAETSGDPYIADDIFVKTLQAFHGDEKTVLSNSWGPPDDGRVDGPGLRRWYNRVDIALTEFGSRGRGGKGGVVVFAAGNGGGFDNANDDGFVSHPYTIAVGAVGDDGQMASYSEPGACIDVVAPSDGGWRGVTTTDIIGHSGYSINNSTGSFGGTSASAPIVAGVIAMLLSVRPDLTLRDVRSILQTTANKVDPMHAGWVTNGVGISYNPWYGFGRVDAGAALRIAHSCESLPLEYTSCGSEWHGSLSLSDVWTLVPLNDINTAFESIEQVSVFIDIDHEWRGDVLLSIISPMGTTSALTFHVPYAVPMRDKRFVPHIYTSLAFLGERSNRSGWQLEMKSVGGGGMFRRALLCVRGVPAYLPPSQQGSVKGRLAMWSVTALWFITSATILCLVTITGNTPPPSPLSS